MHIFPYNRVVCFRPYKACLYCLGQYDGDDERARWNGWKKWFTGMLLLTSTASSLMASHLSKSPKFGHFML